MNASALTPLDYIAAGYWQDFLVRRPIAGGVAYEDELYTCQLDESLASLQRVDTLLTQIRREHSRANTLHENELLNDERYRNLFMFLAFYAGRVLTQHWQRVAHWYGEFELRKRYPELPLIAEDFYQHMAVAYRDDIAGHEALFFPLEPIGMRVFGHIDRAFTAVQGGQVASGLYQAVRARLPHVKDVDNEKITDSIKSADAIQIPITTRDSVTTKDSVSTPQIVDKLQQDSVKVSEQPSSASTQKVAQSVAPTPDIYVQLMKELDEIEVVQHAGSEDYNKARHILDQFEQYIATRQQPRSKISFSAAHLAAKKRALTVLQNAAEQGNTTAMLRLAMYELLGEGLSDSAQNSDSDKSAGALLVERAASKNDSRAQRMLSKMYYQGIGVPQDINSGRYWLEQAAANGHAQAANVIAEWQQAEALIAYKQQDQNSIKRYQWLIGAIVLVALLIIVFV